MPSNKPRVNLTLDDDLYALLGDLGDLQGKRRATVVKEYLEAMRPHMEGFKQALMLLEQKKDPTKHLTKMLIDAQSEFLEVVKGELSDD